MLFSLSKGFELTDRFPPLRWDLPESDGIWCSSDVESRLETVTDAGRSSEEVTLRLEDGKVYHDASLSDRELLEELLPRLGLPAEVSHIAAVIDRARDVQRRNRERAIREEPSPERRLLRAVGEDAIRRRLPAGLVSMLRAEGRGVDTEEVAGLALSVYGVDCLRAFKAELQAAGLDPPDQWAGSPSALAFVRHLGFPREFAGFQNPGRSPLLEVEGPPDVPKLHEFQKTVVREMRALIRGELGRHRGLLSLPTGAGKTRVTVEALIKAMQHDGITGPILWVAQSDELCEQAVQTWSFVWRGLGPSREPLAISRLWGNNEAEPATERAHVVVATVQKLGAGCIDDPDYSWLADAGCVVIDEAHHSTTRSYNNLMRWLELDRRKDARPLIGLTATPFRGTSEQESEALARRYDGRRLDAAAFGEHDPYPLLQEEGILARVRHQELPGADVQLSAAELKRLSETRLFPKSAEDRLGLDVKRNQRLLAEILALPESWTVLVFATSVDHAETLAALLSLEGVPAKPISGQTEPGPRRHYIEEFRAGRIRVLTNYAVLTQGFDAPAVRAIFVARPTYSPNLYQQMVGRGLRGKKNGGKDECLIVNVADNVAQYGDKLAFRYFEYLWNPQSAVRQAGTDP